MSAECCRNVREVTDPRFLPHIVFPARRALSFQIHTFEPTKRTEIEDECGRFWAGFTNSYVFLLVDQTTLAVGGNAFILEALPLARIIPIWSIEEGALFLHRLIQGHPPSPHSDTFPTHLPPFPPPSELLALALPSLPRRQIFELLSGFGGSLASLAQASQQELSRRCRSLDPTQVKMIHTFFHAKRKKPEE